MESYSLSLIEDICVDYWRTDSVTISEDLNVTPVEISGATFDIMIQNQSRTFAQATTDLTLKSVWTMVIYIMRPDSIGMNDVGLTVGVTVFTSNAQHYKEANIEAAQ